MNKTTWLSLLYLGLWVILWLIIPVVWLARGSVRVNSLIALAQAQTTGAVTARNSPLTADMPASAVVTPTIIIVQPTAVQATPTAEQDQEEFAISKIEPGRISKESGGTLSIYGSGFKAGVAVRLVGYGLLDTSFLNPTAIRAVIPPNLPEGRYGVEVIQSDGRTLRVGNAIRIRSSLPEPTETPQPGPLVARPELVVEASESEPDPVRPGDTFTLRLRVVNHGGYTATGIRLALASTELAVPRQGSDLVVLEKLDPAQQATVEMVLALDQEAPSGFLSLPLNIEYSDYPWRDYSSQQNVGITVSDSSAGQPLVLLRAYETQPKSLSPGDAFVLRLELANVGEQDASQLLVTLGGQDGAGTRPFAILGSGNVQFVPSLQAGEEYNLELQLILDGSTESGVYNLPVSLAFEGPGRTSHTEDQVINLLVSRKPNLAIDYYTPPLVGQIGEPLELSIEVVNIGRNLVNVSTVQVSGAGLQVMDGSLFIGALDGGTSGTLDASVIPEKSGVLPVVVTVDYLDDFNQPQIITHTLEVEVMEPVSTPEGPAQGGEERPAGFWDKLLRFLRGIVGLGS